MNPVNRVGVSPVISQLSSTSAKPASAAATTSPARGKDSVELSGVQNYLQVLKTNDVRADKVAAVKSQIEAGTYETEDKLDAAADRLLDELA